MRRKSNWGGRREGSGRKPAENKRVQFSATVDPVTKAIIDEQSEARGITRGEVVDLMAISLKKN